MHSKDNEVKELQKRVKELESQLLAAEIKAEDYDEMMTVGRGSEAPPVKDNISPVNKYQY